MPTIDVNGTTLCYDDTGGPGPAVVFSHALFFDRGMFAPQVAEFGRRYRVVTYDHRGQGASGRSPFVDMVTLAGDAAALITALDLGPVHFVGTCMGGFVALRLAARRPELLRSAVVISSSADEEEKAGNLPSLLEYARTAGIPEAADAMACTVFGDTTLTERVAVLQRWRRHFAALDDPVLAAADAVVRRDGVLGELVGCTVPMLVLSGAEDHTYAPELSQRVADTAANAQHVTVRGAGHALPVEQPLVVGDLVAAHLTAT